MKIRALAGIFGKVRFERETLREWRIAVMIALPLGWAGGSGGAWRNSGPRAQVAAPAIDPRPAPSAFTRTPRPPAPRVIIALS